MRKREFIFSVSWDKDLFRTLTNFQVDPSGKFVATRSGRLSTPERVSVRLAAMTENGGILSLASILLFSKIKPLRGLQRHDWRNKMKIVDKNVQSEALLIFVKNMTLGIFLCLSKKETILSGTGKPRFGLAEQLENAGIRLRGSA